MSRNIDYTELPGIPSLLGLTKTVSKPRVVKAVTWGECRQVQLAVADDSRYGTKSKMMDRIYNALYAPCDQAAVRGTRWFKADRYETVTMGQDLGDGVPVNSRFLAEQEWGRKLWDDAGANLTLQWIDPGLRMPDILVRARRLDGEGGVLGMTVRLAEGDLARAGVSVIVTIDTSEPWTPLFFRTVFAHELGHALGHGHYRLRNLMFAQYRGPMDRLGVQDLHYHHEKYVDPGLAA